MENLNPDSIIYNNKAYQDYQTTVPVYSFISKVYLWMMVGIGLTAITSFIMAFTGIGYLLAPFYFIFMISELGLVIILSFFINKLNTYVAALMFLLYSFLNGITFATIFMIYDMGSIFITFFATSSLFGVMALYGWITKQDLTKFGNLALMGLLGIIMGSIINIFLNIEVFSWLLTYIGIGIFLVLIAWDTQKIKRLSNLGYDSNKLAIIGALTLYLDFINLFLRLLQIFGRRK